MFHGALDCICCCVFVEPVFKCFNVDGELIGMGKYLCKRLRVGFSTRSVVRRFWRCSFVFAVERVREGFKRVGWCVTSFYLDLLYVLLNDSSNNANYCPSNYLSVGHSWLPLHRVILSVFSTQKWNRESVIFICMIYLCIVP